MNIYIYIYNQNVKLKTHFDVLFENSYNFVC